MSGNQREKFEAAIAKNQLAGGFPPAHLERCGLDGEYIRPEVGAAWWGWQVAAQSAAGAEIVDALQQRLNIADQQVDDLQVGLEAALSLIGRIFIAGGAPLDSALDEWVESLRRDAGLLYLLLDGIEEGRVVVFKKEPAQTTYLEDRAAIAWALGSDVSKGEMV